MSSADLLDDLIRSVLNDPLPDEVAPSWTGVLRRVPAPARRRIRTRRLVLAFAIVVLVLVPPAVAFHSDLADWILGKPAPEPVARAFEGWNRLAASQRDDAYGQRLFAGQLSEVDVSKAQGVVAFETPDGTVSLWDVPQRRGGRCWMFVAGDVATSRHTIGSCDLAGAPTEALSRPEWIGLGELPDVLIVHARVRDGVSVELRLADGRTKPMDVVAGHAVAAIPRDSASVILVAKDVDGKPVQVAPLPLPPPGLLDCPDMCSGGGGGVSMHVGSVTMRKH